MVAFKKFFKDLKNEHVLGIVGLVFLAFALYQYSNNKNILKIKKGEKWIHKNKDMILLDLIDSKYVMLDDHFNLIINGEKLNKFTKDIYTKFRDKYDDGDKGLMSEIKENCNLMMMDHKEN